MNANEIEKEKKKVRFILRNEDESKVAGEGIYCNNYNIDAKKWEKK